VPLAPFLVALGLLDTIVQSEAGSHSWYFSRTKWRVRRWVFWWKSRRASDR